MIIRSDQLPTIKKELLEEIREWLGHLNTNKDHVITSISDDLEGSYRMLAVVSFLNDGDVNAFHSNMYLAAAVRLRLLNCVRAGMDCEPAYLNATYDRSIYEGLVCGEEDVLLKLARDKHTTKVDQRFDNPYYYSFALALRLIILSSLKDAEKAIDRFNQKRNSNLEGYALILEGIMNDDHQAFNDGLRIALDKRKEEISRDEDVNVGEQWISVECLALARLGLRHNMKITVQDGLIPSELLGTVNTAYPDAGAVFPPIPRKYVRMPEEDI